MNPNAEMVLNPEVRCVERDGTITTYSLSNASVNLTNLLQHIKAGSRVEFCEGGRVHAVATKQ